MQGERCESEESTHSSRLGELGQLTGRFSQCGRCLLDICVWHEEDQTLRAVCSGIYPYTSNIRTRGRLGRAQRGWPQAEQSPPHPTPLRSFSQQSFSFQSPSQPVCPAFVQGGSPGTFFNVRQEKSTPSDIPGLLPGSSEDTSAEGPLRPSHPHPRTTPLLPPLPSPMLPTPSLGTPPPGSP